MDMSYLISWGARTHKGSTAFIHNGQEWTFAEIDRRAERLAHGLLRVGLVKGDRVAVLVSNRPEYAISEFAVAKAGGMRVPLLVGSTATELIRWLDSAQVAYVIACPDGVEILRSVRGKTAQPFLAIVIDRADPGEIDFETLISEAPDGPVNVTIRPEDPYAIRFTGGTTGVPKGVVMSHQNMVTATLNGILNLVPQRSDIALTLHPMTHACGFMMYQYWLVGAKNVITPAFGFNVSNFVRVVQEYRVTSIMMIPTILNPILDSVEAMSADLSSIRHIIYGGAPIPLPRLEQGLKRFGNVFQQIYGLSESPMFIATLRRDEHLLPDGSKPKWFGSVGREALNAQLKIIDEAAKEVPPMQVGEIASRGSHTMVGYWANPDLSASKYTADGWVRTGDIGYFDNDGYLFLVDRKEDMIITGGFNVWPAEVEDVLYQHPAVAEGCVFGVKNERWGEVVCGMVVIKKDMLASESEIVAFMVERLTKYKVPKHVWLADEPVPKSGLGKPLRRIARERFLAVRGDPGVGGA